MQDSRDGGQVGCRKVGIQDRGDAGREIQDRLYAGFEGCREGGIQDQRDTVKEGQDAGRRDAEQQRCWTEVLQERWDAGKEAYRVL